ncbi:histidine phosphatase family protein [Boudabousia liubingyangii]|uniref:histidine phosphatase family protein n=1 Tax=Boudabousia liubingyangii TaxID=1921764 RepID=UPI000940427E|nr:histidine phosphatase family protein [Boudabousia liubingyangii]OKL46928.1 histidine phosphatase family protein [Boudabousia liubingyangii]
MTHTIVHVMRHGEVHNPEGVLYARLPGFSLSQLGFQMAQKGADFFTEHGSDIAVVKASPLLRAQQTALPTAKAYGLEVQSDPRLIEAANVFEGQSLHRDRSVLWRNGNWKYLLNPLRPSWGEPFTAQVDRMRAAVSDVIDEAWGRQALLVSHQLPIWLLRSFAEGRPLVHDPRKRECALASVTTLHFDEHTLVGVEYAEPSASLMAQATDMTPGASKAAVNKG